MKFWISGRHRGSGCVQGQVDGKLWKHRHINDGLMVINDGLVVINDGEWWLAMVNTSIPFYIKEVSISFGCLSNWSVRIYPHTAHVYIRLCKSYML